MIVDDDDQILVLIEILLRRQGYQVLKAPSAASALEQLKTNTPDLFILDYMMPGMNGIELCQQIRLDPKVCKAPVIMLSALDNEAFFHQCVEAGADGTIAKSEMHRRLLSEVRDYLALAQSG